MTDRAGQLFGNYRLLRLIGRGSLTEVYLGEHLHLGTKATVKVLHTQLASDELEQFRAEARTVAALAHPHIVRVLDFGVEEGIPFLVMDYAPNGTMRQRIPKGMRLPPESILPYVKQVASALQYVHDQRSIHRNVKPENMLLGSNDEVLLDDFGFSVVCQSSSMLSIQKPIGTMGYMAPEQLQGKPRPASDQYALGIVVYEWLSGYRPFRGSLRDIANQHMLTPPAPLHERFLSISQEVEQVVLKALEKDPHRRFASVQDFATAFERACWPQLPLYSASTLDVEWSLTDTQPLSTPSPPASGTQAQRRFPRRTFVMGLAGLAVAGGGLAWLALSRESGNIPISISANLNIYVRTDYASSTHHSFAYALRASDGNQRWRHTTEGSIFSLIESGGIVYIKTFSYLGGDLSTALPSSVLALRTADGAPLWHFPITSTQRSLLVVDKGVVYIGTTASPGQNAVYALRASDGTVLWKYKVQGNEQTILTSLQGVNSVVYLSTEDQSPAQQIVQRSTVYALRTSDRTLLWEYAVDHASAVISVANGIAKVFIFSGTNSISLSLVILQASDGKLLWQLKLGDFIQIWETSDTFYVAQADSFQSQRGTVSALRPDDGSQLWHYQTDGMPEQMKVNKGVLYVATQKSGPELLFYAFQAANGKLLWQKQMKGRPGLFLVTDQVLFVDSMIESSSSSTATLYALQPSDGTILWSYQQREPILRLVADDGVIYFDTFSSKSGSSVCAYQATNGILIWCHQLEAKVNGFVVG